MTSRAVLVPALLCCIIQIALTSTALGLDEPSRGSSSTILDQIFLKKSIPIQGLSKLNVAPVIVNLTLHATLNEIRASWSLSDPDSFRGLWYHVSIAGGDEYTPQNFYIVRGLSCNTSYTFEVNAIDDGGAPIGNAKNATIITKGVPELVNFALQATTNEIKAKWSLNDPKCFPDLSFRVTAAGVDEIVSQNSYYITGLDCNTSYNVTVSLVDVGGAPIGVPTNGTIITKAVELVNLTLQATIKEITVRWSLNDPKCFPDGRFRVTTAGFDQIVSQNEYNISGLACHTTYEVTVSLVDAEGVSNGISRNASIKTEGVSELVNLTLRATNKEITVSWSLKDFECFPFTAFRVTTDGVNQIVKQNVYNQSGLNFYTISGLVCNTIYNVKVTAVDALGYVNGGSTNATTVTREVPQLVNLTLRATINGITAAWSMKDFRCYPDVRFRIVTAGINQSVSQTTYAITGLACNTSYNVMVSPLDVFGTSNGVSTNATISTKAVPELLNLTLQSTLYGITARWSLNDPKCFPDLRFRVTTAGVDKIVFQNPYNITGLACNTNYKVMVSPVDAFGAPNGVSTNATIITKGVPELVNFTLQATLYQLTARWSVKDAKCFPGLKFRITTARGNFVTLNNDFAIGGLTCNTSYNIMVSLLYGNGLSSGVSTNATIVTMEVPELHSLSLRATLHGITTSWYLRDQKCFPNLRFRVITAGVDQIVSQNGYNISGLACNTIYNLTIFPVDAFGAPNGVPINGTIRTMGVPQVVNLTLEETLNVITARWSLKNPECFPDVRFIVNNAGFRKTVSQNTYNTTGLACNQSYYFTVSPVDTTGALYGVSTSATIMFKGAPEVIHLILRETLNEITASWTLQYPKCFPNMRFRITTAGVDKIVSQYSYTISGLACNTLHHVKVSAVDSSGVPYGISTNNRIMRRGVPELVNLTLQAIPNGFTARWSQKYPTCFPNVRFRVTTTGVDKIVLENSYNITGLACDTSYYVKVSPVDTNGALFGVPTNATIKTNGVQVTLYAMVAESLVLKWAPLQGSCPNFVNYEVTLSLLNGTSVKKIITKKTHLVFAGLNASTVYRVRFQPQDVRGVPIGGGAAGQRATLNATSVSGRCPFPTIAIAAWKSTVLCAGIMKPTPSTNLEANKVCYSKNPPTAANPYVALMYLVAQGWMPYGYIQEYLRLFDYTEELLVNGYYRNGSWVWGFGTNYAATYTIDPALLVGLPAGGDGPNDYKMLYADPAKNYNLNVAKIGHSFGAMICAFPLAM